MPSDDPSSSSGASSDNDSPSDRDWDDWGGDDDDNAAANASANADISDEEEETATTSLFDNSAVLPSASAALAHDAQEHGFDLIEFRKKLSLDDYGTFRVVNFIRSEVAAGRDPKPALAEAEKSEGGGEGAAAAPWDDDAFLVPFNPEDPLLFYEYDDDEEGERGDSAAGRGRLGGQAAEGGEGGLSSAQQLRAENDALRSALAALAAASLPPEAAAALPAPIVEALRGVGWGGDGGGSGAQAAEDDDDEGRLSAGGGGGALLPKKRGGGGAAGGSTTKAVGAGISPSCPSPASASASAAAAAQKKEREVDDAYFDSYGGLGIHREMLSDEARTGAYRRALEENPTLMKGATVLDVGAGTGVLSLFAARAGASAVVAVEASARVAALARENALANGFRPFSSRLSSSSSSSSSSSTTTTTVTVVNARLEDIERLPGIEGGKEGAGQGEAGGGEGGDESEAGRVDVLVSEWMGYALFFECMLDSVILARDRFLKKRGGAILPDRATISIAGVSPLASDLAFWEDVHGLDLSACAKEVRARRARHGAVVAVAPSHVVTSAATVHELDLLTCAVGDEAFSTPFELRALPPPEPKEGGEAPAAKEASAAAPPAVLLGGVALWFDVEFSARACPDAPVLLSTSPSAPQTHWHQALLELPSPMEMVSPSSSSSSSTTEEAEQGAAGAEGRRRVSAVRGRVSLSRGPCHRSVDVALEVQGFDSRGGAVPGTRHVGLYPFAMSD